MIRARRRNKMIFGRQRGGIRIIHKGRFVLFVCLVAALVLGFCARTIYAVRRKVDEYNNSLELDTYLDTDKKTGEKSAEAQDSQVEQGLEEGEKATMEEALEEEKDSKMEQNSEEEKELELEGEKESNVDRELKESGEPIEKNNEATKDSQLETLDDIEHKEFFSDSVFLGDSITEAISFYGFVDRSRVIADKGLTASKGIGKVDQVELLKPSKIFILFGMNDVLSLDKSEKFVANYTDLISKLQLKLPDAEIYVQSILYVDPKVRGKKPLLTNERIDEFNKALQGMAKEKGVKYLEINSVANAYDGNLLEPDGIHYIYKFYDMWLSYIRRNI